MLVQYSPQLSREPTAGWNQPQVCWGPKSQEFSGPALGELSVEPQSESYGTLTQHDEGTCLTVHAKNDVCFTLLPGPLHCGWRAAIVFLKERVNSSRYCFSSLA